MAELLRKQQQVLVTALETVYGTDPTPTGANAVLAHDISVNMLDSSTDTRNNMNGRLGNQGEVTVSRHTSSNFGVEFAGSGDAAVAPAWGAMLQMCGMAELVDGGASTVTYTPIDSLFPSGTQYFRIGLLQQILTGTRGKFTLSLDKGAIPKIKFDMLSLYQAPTVELTDMAGVDTSAYQSPIGVTIASAVCTFLGTVVKMSKLSVDPGIGVKYLDDLGGDAVEIESRNGTVSISFRTNEQELVDAIEYASDNTTGAVNFVLGNVAGRTLTVNVPQVQVKTAKVSWDGEFAYCDVEADIVPNARNNDFSIVQS